MLPKISFLARLTRDVETRFTDAGMCIAKVGLACSEKYGDKETQLFINGTAFKKTGEMIANISKGQRVFVAGKLQTDSWQNKETGQKRSVISMIIESFEFIEKRQENQCQQQGGFQNTGTHGSPQQPGFQQPQNNGFQAPQQPGFQQQSPPDDDIPF